MGIWGTQGHRGEARVTEAEVGMMLPGPQPRNAGSTASCKGQRRFVSWSLHRVHSPANTSTWDLRPPEL